ncbi:GNAT family N-acetyltransferase [Marinactinospora rubrisoli]|uniref:GNAT family N-acetyltransferase n=1 Tax=Marinactinospora rubrisoli TaxID=2715399 RepID=A0ABW2KDA4_9ACTN
MGAHPGRGRAQASGRGRPPGLTPTVIEAGDLTLEPLRVSHAEEMSAALADPELFRYIGGTPPSAARLRSRYADMLAGSDEPGACPGATG